jgi:hypothetical protein
MTMIAGFKIDETPFLFGDFVTSVPDSERGGARRHGVTKKIAILSPNCAIAWTGSAYSAGQVLDELFERFRNVDVKREEIEGYLTNREPDSSFFDVKLVVWVVEAEQSLFMWSSSVPTMPCEYEPVVAGSGQDTFEDMQRRLEPYRIPQLEGMEKLARAMMYYTELLTLEVKEPDPTFGFGYEIAAFF